MSSHSISDFVKQSLFNVAAVVRLALGGACIYAAMNSDIFFRAGENFSKGLNRGFVSFLVASCCYLIYLSVVRKQVGWVVLWIAAIVYVNPITLVSKQAWTEYYFLTSEFRNAALYFGLVTIASVFILRDCDAEQVSRAPK